MSEHEHTAKDEPGNKHVVAAREQGLALAKPEQFDSESGIGVRGSVEGKALALGNTALMDQLGVQVDALKAQAEELRGQGASVMHQAVDGQLAGLLAVSDPIKATARAVGKRLGIDEVHGEVKPADKLAMVERLQREGRHVAMAGDGINDAPRWRALTSASRWAPAPTWP